MPDYRKSRSCKGKHQHKSEGAAKAQLRSMVTLLNRNPYEFNIYKCPFCRHYHVGRASTEVVQHRMKHKESPLTS